MNKQVFFTPFLCLPMFAFSAEPIAEQAFGISSAAELGILYKTGNTKSVDLKTGVDFKFEKKLWRSILDFDLLVKQTEQENAETGSHLETSDQKWTLESKTNYTLNKTSNYYVYGDLAYEDNRFSGFDNQSSASIGLGRQWLKTQKSSLFTDIGPGYKRDVTQATATQESETHSSFIIQAQLLYLRQLNEHVDFQQIVSVKYAPQGGENSKYKSETSISTKLIETLQLKFSFLVDHNTEVEPSTKRTDSQTSMTLVYSF